MNDNRIRLQYPRDFTVQIRHSGTGAIVGTGIAVSTDGKIVTCAHVVEAALGVHPRHAGSRPVKVYFPQAPGADEEERQATVAACFETHDDDVVLLQLTGGPPPLGPEQVAVLGTAEPSGSNRFRCYGYRRLESYLAGWAHGTIMGCVECPEGRDLQTEPVQLESSQINRGMSGAGVLDVVRNLVVGIVSETWFPDRTMKDRDTAWAVDARVLTFEPLSLMLRDDPLPLRPAPMPRIDLAEARSKVAPAERIVLSNAPPPLGEWVGRQELLKALTEDWVSPALRVTGLIGLGGEGKSSLARRWVDSLLKSNPVPQPDGVFWWGFYEKRNVDEFFEAALAYMSGGKIDARDYPSSSAKAHLIAGMLGAGRYLFILDGLEVMQHQEGDGYGLIRNNDLREFLGYFASPAHKSHCLITSRAPLLDLIQYTTCVDRDVERLSAAEARELLRKLGVKGRDQELDKLVADWEGHALTLSLLGTYLTEQYAGDIARAADIRRPAADEQRYQRVDRVLRRYDECLTEAERAFMELFSAFRTPVGGAAFEKVFRSKAQASDLNTPIAALPETAFSHMVRWLATCRMLRYNPEDQNYTTHPLVRAHYGDTLDERERAKVQAAHRAIKAYYLTQALPPPQFQEILLGTAAMPSLEQFVPLIEAVHHACQAGDYDEAYQVHREMIDQGERRPLTYHMGAYETALSTMLEFFAENQERPEPLVSDPRHKYFILNSVGFYLMNLGRLAEAPPFFAEATSVAEAIEDWPNVSVTYNNLADLSMHLGQLAAASDAARKAAEYGAKLEGYLASIAAEDDERGRQAKREWLERIWGRDPVACEAWVAHLRGDIGSASELFREAEGLEKAADASKRYLYSLRGVRHADHLLRIGETGYARAVAESNLDICKDWLEDFSLCYRVLGDLEARESRHKDAGADYDEALRIGRNISHRPALVEALLARGRWAGRYMRDPDAAFSDLNEALGYAVEGGYRIYEADIRNALAWAHIAAGDNSKARAEAERARQMSEEMGYYWGKADAAEVLAALTERE